MQNYYQFPSFRQPYQNGMNSHHTSCVSKGDAQKEFPPAMAYVPWQKYKEPYPVCKGFLRGTIFEDLDKPFLGKGGCCL